MKKFLLRSAIISILGLTVAVHAQASSFGASGLINFIGSITTDSCALRDNNAVRTSGALTYNMGPVSVNALGTEAAPMTSAVGSITALPVDMNMQLECLEGVAVDLTLTPAIVSGKGIGLTGGAQNVQIMLMHGSNPVDFSGGSQTINASMNRGKANILMKAYYTLVAGSAVSNVTAGSANGTVGYMISYH
ncbi:fimbrial protein [Comamonas testosteroni]|uniref:fimbrial protein n=1 Tax=Comamonas testosteroni TaxID=285 RepID=UPI0005B39427|nr:hypothetical protein [Comamonas testosteroni]